MSALLPGDPSFGGGSKCHVCGKPVDMSEPAVEHDGTVLVRTREISVEGHGHILMHPECAVVLAMRLVHDTMKQNIPNHVRPINVLTQYRRSKGV